MSTPSTSRLPIPLPTTASTTGEAEPTSATERTRSSSSSGMPVSPAETCSSAAPAICVMVCRKPATTLSLASYMATSTATPSAIPASVSRQRNRCFAK